MKICVVGAGKLGAAVTKALLGGGNDLTVIDISSQKIQNIGNQMDVMTVQADALKVDTLRDVEVENYDILISCAKDDEENITIAALAKKLGCPRVIARVRDPRHLEQLDFLRATFGIDQLLNPDYACAREIFKYLTQEHSLEGGVFTQDGISIFEFSANKLSGLSDKPIRDASVLLKGILIGAISRKGQIIIPKGNTVIETDDTVYAVGLVDDIKNFAKRIQADSKSNNVKRVMIAGGGKTGYFLAQMLSKEKIATKIIENNLDRCEVLSAQLDDVVVLHGDAANIDVLREENLEAMDAFVASTGIDEENLLLSLLVKEYGVEDVVAKVSRNTFAPIVKKLGASAIINPLEIISSDILSYVRKSGVVLFSKLINGQAEFREIQVESSMPITKKTLAELDIPDGILVIAIHRAKNIIIPNGNTQIVAGDRVVLLTLLSENGELESLLTETNKSVL